MAKISLVLTGFRRLKRMLSPGTFERRLQKHVKAATMLNALLAEGEIKTDISANRFKKNAARTIAIKRSSKPLAGVTGELFKSVIGRAVAWDTALIGVLKSKKVKNKQTGKVDDILQIAAILHDGATITVTDRMRRYFFLLASKKGSRTMPLRASTKVIVIPPRPFLRGVTKKRLVKKYKANWQRAIGKAMRGIN